VLSSSWLGTLRCLLPSFLPSCVLSVALAGFVKRIKCIIWGWWLGELSPRFHPPTPHRFALVYTGIRVIDMCIVEDHFFW
jgi:hypothetical protein